MKVRVFSYTGEVGAEYSGEDFDFEVLPQIDQFLRFTGRDDEKVEKVGFIQDGESFIAAVWLEARPTFGMHVIG